MKSKIACSLLFVSLVAGLSHATVKHNARKNAYKTHVSRVELEYSLPNARFHVQDQDLWLGGTGYWSDGSHWSLGAPPADGSDAVIYSGSHDFVTLDMVQVNLNSLTLGGSLGYLSMLTDGGSTHCLGTDYLMVGASGIVFLDGAESKLKVTGTATNNGIIVMESPSAILDFAGNTFNNSGLIDNAGWLENSRIVTSFGTINNLGRMDNKSAATLNNYLTLNNSGTITNSYLSTINNNAGGTINNSGTIDSTAGRINNNSGGTINNSGTLDLAWFEGFLNNGGTINNYGVLRYQFMANSGTLSNNSGGTLSSTPSGEFTNDGSLFNQGTLSISSGMLFNNGELYNSDSGMIHSLGRISNTGRLSNYGVLDNEYGWLGNS